MKETAAFTPAPINLETLLAAKDERFSLQQALLKKYSLPLVSLTITLPGPIKLNETAKFLFDNACQALTEYYQQQQIDCLEVIQRIKVTGPEAFFVFNMQEDALKLACIEIEQQHPLGRLWDMDVFSASSFTAMSRRQFGYAARKCLMCDNDAKVCGRARLHSLDQLNQKIENLVSQYKACLR